MQIELLVLTVFCQPRNAKQVRHKQEGCKAGVVGEVWRPRQDRKQGKSPGQVPAAGKPEVVRSPAWRRPLQKVCHPFAAS